MGVDGATFCPGYVFTGKTYCPRTKCCIEILLLALPFQPIGAQFIISSSWVHHFFTDFYTDFSSNFSTKFSTKFPPPIFSLFFSPNFSPIFILIYTDFYTDYFILIFPLIFSTDFSIYFPPIFPLILHRCLYRFFHRFLYWFFQKISIDFYTNFPLIFPQNCIMSIFLHGAKFSNQILPQEKCVICNNFSVFSEFSLLKRWFWSKNIINFIALS